MKTIHVSGPHKWIEVPKDFTGVAIDTVGTIFYYNDGQFHRDGGPALIFINGMEHWYQNGRLHRNYGPAVDGKWASSYEWYINGLRHREDGPAVIGYDGPYYYLNGVEYSFDEFWARQKNTKYAISIMTDILGKD